MMRTASDQIREIAPGMGDISREALDEVLAQIDGPVEVTTNTGIALGSTSYRAAAVAQVIVQLEGVSRGSGGELYGVSSVHTPNEDHYIISSSIRPILEPIER